MLQLFLEFDKLMLKSIWEKNMQELSKSLKTQCGKRMSCLQKLNIELLCQNSKAFAQAHTIRSRN